MDEQVSKHYFLLLYAFCAYTYTLTCKLKNHIVIWLFKNQSKAWFFWSLSHFPKSPCFNYTQLETANFYEFWITSLKLRYLSTNTNTCVWNTNENPNRMHIKKDTQESSKYFMYVNYANDGNIKLKHPV